MGNYAGHSHVTGSGYNSITRKCVKCKHEERFHWENHCAAWKAVKQEKYTQHVKCCGCRGFAARQLTREERQIIAAQLRDQKVAASTSEEEAARGRIESGRVIRPATSAARVTEGWLSDLLEDWKHRDVS